MIKKAVTVLEAILILSRPNTNEEIESPK